MGEVLSMKTAILLSVLCALAASAEDLARQPKLFYVSTSVTTSTLQTASICYVSSTSLTTCTGRKRRAIEMASADTSAELEPSHSGKHDTASSVDDSREGRFLLYWITTTSISTSTSFTTTFTVSSALCTHTGASL